MITVALSSSIKDWISTQTAVDKIAITLVGLSFPVVSIFGAVQFLGMCVLTAFIVRDKHRHQESMSNFT